MNTLIVFSSRKGFIREAAERLQKSLGGNAVLCDLKGKGEEPDAYDFVVLCGAFHAGKLPGRLRSYMKKYEKDLKGMKSAFLLGGMDQEHFAEVFSKNMPPSLADMPLFYTGGRYLPEDHNPVIRMMMAKISGQEGAIHNERWEAVEELAKSLV